MVSVSDTLEETEKKFVLPHAIERKCLTPIRASRDMFPHEAILHIEVWPLKPFGKNEIVARGSRELQTKS